MAFITTMPPPPMSYRQYFRDLRRYEHEDFSEPLTDKKADKADKADKKADKKAEGFWASFKSFWKVNHRIRINRIT